MAASARARNLYRSLRPIWYCVVTVSIASPRNKASTACRRRLGSDGTAWQSSIIETVSPLRWNLIYWVSQNAGSAKWWPGFDAK